MKVALIQFDIKWEDQQANFDRVKFFIKEAKNKNAELVCLPELFSTGVTTNSLKFSETIKDKTCNFLSEHAMKNKIYLLGSFIENNGKDLPKNSVVLYNPEGLIVGKYSKNHLFTYNNEHKYYSHGNDLMVVNIDNFNICPLICYDLRFPELFRISVDMGANVFIISANWPNPRKEHWITLLKARAIENQSYVLGINRVGNSPDLSFFGGSMIVSPKGEIVAQAGDKEEILIDDIKIEEITEWRNTFNSLRDRRVNYYDSLNREIRRAKKIKIKNKFVGERESVFIIGEAGVNHNGDINLAKKLIDVAKDAGCDAVKFQTFKAEGVVTGNAKRASYQIKNIGGNETQQDMLRKYELSYDDFIELKKYCEEKGIIFLSTPHSCKEDVDLVAKLCPAIKVSSGDLTNLPILKYIAQKNLPIILSTGMANLEEVKEAVETILPINKELILLHCTTNYPTALNEVNLKAMLTMKREFKLPVGYSDHTEGIKVSLAAVALGACIIEKHFTLDKKLPGPDHKASLEPQELKAMVKGIRDIEKRLAKGEKADDLIKELKVEEALGDGIKIPAPSEVEIARLLRKSIVARVDIPKGRVIQEDMLEIKRPGTGILPKYLKNIVGRIARKKIKKDEVIEWNMIRVKNE